jgi:hypothetical protein
VSVPAPSPPPDTDGPRRAWNGVIAVAGAVAGLAVLLYLVGAVTMWARFRAGELPADLAVDHYPRGQLIALGLRGVFYVAVAIAVFLALAYLLLLAWSYLAPRRRELRSAPNPVRHPTRLYLYAYAKQLQEQVVSQNVLDACAPAVRRLRIGHFRLLGLVGATALIISMFISWHVLAVALGLVVATGATFRYLYKRPERARPSLALIVITLLAVGAAGIIWQLQPPVKVQAVIVLPLPEAKGLPDDLLASTEGIALPYFGETNDQVFVGEVRRATAKDTHGMEWTYTGRIVEIRRDGVRLIFELEKGILYQELRSPGCVLTRDNVPYLC